MTFVRDTRGWQDTWHFEDGGIRRVLGIVSIVVSLVAVPFAARVLADSTSIALPKVLAVVNGDTITSADLDRLLISTHQSMDASQRRGFDYERLLTRLVNDRLLIQEAMALGMNEDAKLVEKLEGLKRARAVRLWIRDNFKAEREVPEDSVLVYFRDNFNRVETRVIAAQEHDEAVAARDAILAGASMDSLAREISIDKYKANGGLRRASWYVDVEPVLRDLSDTLAVGALSDVFPYRSVYAIARIEKDIPADTAELPLVRTQIETWLGRRTNEMKWAAFMDSVRATMSVEDHASVLDRIRADSSNLYTPNFGRGTLDAAVTINATMVVTDQDIRSKVGHGAMVSATTPFDILFRDAYKELTEDAILATAAYADRYDTLPGLIRYLRQIEDSALVAMYIEETVTPRIVFNHKEFDDYKSEHPEEFREPDNVLLDELTVDSQDVAFEIYGRLKDGADFSYLVRQYGAGSSELESTSNFMKVSAFPADMQSELDSLKIGDCLRPRRTEEGWTLLRLRARQQGEQLSVEEMETHLRAVMFQSKFNDELDSVLTILRENSEIQYNDAAIREYFGSDS